MKLDINGHLFTEIQESVRGDETTFFFLEDGKPVLALCVSIHVTEPNYRRSVICQSITSCKLQSVKLVNGLLFIVKGDLEESDKGKYYPQEFNVFEERNFAEKIYCKLKEMKKLS